jgi:hypothetical protein
MRNAHELRSVVPILVVVVQENIEIVSANYNSLWGEHFVVAISELGDG